MNITDTLPAEVVQALADWQRGGYTGGLTLHFDGGEVRSIEEKRAKRIGERLTASVSPS